VPLQRAGALIAQAVEKGFKKDQIPSAKSCKASICLQRGEQAWGRLVVWK